MGPEIVIHYDSPDIQFSLFMILAFVPLVQGFYICECLPIPRTYISPRGFSVICIFLYQSPPRAQDTNLPCNVILPPPHLSIPLSLYPLTLYGGPYFFWDDSIKSRNKIFLPDPDLEMRKETKVTKTTTQRSPEGRISSVIIMNSFLKGQVVHVSYCSF